MNQNGVSERDNCKYNGMIMAFIVTVRENLPSGITTAISHGAFPNNVHHFEFRVKVHRVQLTHDALY